MPSTTAWGKFCQFSFHWIRQRLAYRLALAIVFCVPIAAHAQDMWSKAAAPYRPTLVKSITMTGTATRFPGSNQRQGNVTLKMSSLGMGILLFEDQYSPIEETIPERASSKPCQKTDSAGNLVDEAWHNCFLPAPWFLPQLSLFSLDSSQWTHTLGASGTDMIGIDIRNEFYDHPKQEAAVLSNLSSVSAYFDRPSLFLTMYCYTLHPLNNANAGVPAVVLYSDYRMISGVPIPFRIKQYLASTIAFDIQIENAQVSN